MSSIGVDFKSKQIEIDDKLIKLQIWDTAGHEKFRTITTSYYKSAHAIIILYDITEQSSFDHINNWMIMCKIINHIFMNLFLYIFMNYFS